MDCSKPDICETFDIHSEVPRHVEVAVLLERVSNTRERTITLDVEMEDYYRLKNVRGSELYFFHNYITKYLSTWMI